MRKNKRKEITDYDRHETSLMIDRRRPLQLKDLGLELPRESPTEVVSIRLPTRLLKALRAWASAQDIPYQALIKLILSQGMARAKVEV